MLPSDSSCPFQSVSCRPPWVPHVSFPPSICRIYCTWFRVAIGLYLDMQTYPHVQPYMRFLSVRPEVCPWISSFPTSGFLQIPPHSGHPCLRLYPSRYRADLGLSPLRNVRRQAHICKIGTKTHADFLSYFPLIYDYFCRRRYVIINPFCISQIQTDTSMRSIYSKPSILN